jgi:hypothetical protein
MSEEPGVVKFVIRDLLDSAQSLVTGPGLYANEARFSVSQNEIIIDFYAIGPSARAIKEPEPIHIQRILLPIGIGKGFVTGLANSIARFEKALNVTLPNPRGKTEDDIIEIWK